MNEELTVKPLQPYMIMQADNLTSVDCDSMGISHFYEFEIRDTKAHCTKAVPDGSIDCLFSLGKDRVTTYISGTVFGVKPWELGENNKCFGVRFQPGKGVLPDGLSMDMLVDNDLLIDGDLFGDHICEKLAVAGSMQERCEIFRQAYEELVYNRICRSDREKINDYLVSRITRAKGQVTMAQLERETNYSACYLRRIFKEYHGISPKQFAQFVRFQNLLKKLEQETRYDDIAVACGYYDEAHMMKEFKKFTGKTIDAYQHMMRRD